MPDTPDTPITPTTLEEATAKLAELEQKSQEYLDGWKRAKADYINQKNDYEKRGKELAQFAGMAIIAQLIPVLENFRTAFTHVPADQTGSEWVTGIEHIYNQMKEIMKGMGVEEFTPEIGQPLDPANHEAVGQESTPDGVDDAISQVVSAGYTLHGKVIVPARVIVNKKP